MKKKKCELCGKEFIRPNGAKYCSPQCTKDDMRSYYDKEGKLVNNKLKTI